MPSIRLATNHDVPRIRDIYSPYILNTTTSFEMEVPTIEEMGQRINKYMQKGPWLVMVEKDEIMGYAYASEHRSRAAYQWSIELSVYVADLYQGKGIATKLYSCALDILKVQGYCTILAGVTQPNDPSNAFHEKFGFKYLGTYQNIGYKHDKWCDVKWYELFIEENQANPLPIKSLKTLAETGSLQRILENHNA